MCPCLFGPALVLIFFFSHDSIRERVRSSVRLLVRTIKQKAANMSRKQTKDTNDGEAGKDLTTHHLFRVYELIIIKNTDNSFRYLTHLRDLDSMTHLIID